MKNRKKVCARFALLFCAVLLSVSGLYGDTAGEQGAGHAFFALAALASEVSPEEAQLQAQYDAAQALFDAKEYEKALEAFEALGKFSDSASRAADSRRKWKAARYKEAVSLFNNEQFQEAKTIFDSLDTYEKSRSYAGKCATQISRAIYAQAKEAFAAEEYEKARNLFLSIGKFHDSPERAQAADDKLKALEQAAAELKLYEQGLALKEAGDLEGARDLFIQAGPCEGATEQLYEIMDILTVRAAYEKANACYDSQEYKDAWGMFWALGDHEDSREKAELSKQNWQGSVYDQAIALRTSDPVRSYMLLASLEGFKDSGELADEIKATLKPEDIYALACEMDEKEEYALAQAGFAGADGYEDSQERLVKARENAQKMQEYEEALYLRAVGREAEANAIFEGLGKFSNAKKMIAPVIPTLTAKQLRDYKTSEKSPVFTAADGSTHTYQIFKGVRTWVAAKRFCEMLGGHLATMTTPEENQFVYRFMRDSGYLTAYFGLWDEHFTDDWAWVTGEPFAFSNWHKGEPSRSLRERYGMYFYKHTDATWNDSHFYEHWKDDTGCSFICEWDH